MTTKLDIGCEPEKDFDVNQMHLRVCTYGPECSQIGGLVESIRRRVDIPVLATNCLGICREKHKAGNIQIKEGTEVLGSVAGVNDQTAIDLLRIELARITIVSNY